MDLKKKEIITDIIFKMNLKYTDEDREKLNKLILSYCRKKTGVSNSKIENISGGLLWVYSRINFLFEHDENWSQKSIAEKLNIKPKTISNKAGEIMNALKINCFDERFARKKIADSNPLNNFYMTKEGFILMKDDNSEDSVNGNNILINEKEIDIKNKKLGEFFK